MTRISRIETEASPHRCMVAAVILAAGRSLRMGTPKFLLPLDGHPLVARLVDALQSAAIEPIIVVTGTEDALVAAALGNRAIRRVRNPAPDGDMLSSVRCGVRALPDGWAACLFAPGDAPGLSANLAASLVTEWRRTGRSLVVPAHRGQRGHPLLVAARHRDEILSGLDGVGLRGLLAHHAEDVAELGVDTDAILANWNRPADFAAGRSGPTDH